MASRQDQDGVRGECKEEGRCERMCLRKPRQDIWVSVARCRPERVLERHGRQHAGLEFYIGEKENASSVPQESVDAFM